jgi:23S rRNA pseudouridine1911/1915/1917 synthase
MITEFHVMPGERAKRLDAFLVSHERGVSRSSLQRLILAGRIRVNAHIAKPSQKIKPGDRIAIDKPEPGPLMVNDKVVPLELLYEDEALLVVNKPAGVVVHPTSGNWHGTLLNGLLEHFQSNRKINGLKHLNVDPGMVHRLDKETSGVMVVAKTDQAHRDLCSQFEKHTITRTYEALMYGIPAEDHGTIDVETAITEFKVIQQFGDVSSHVELTPHTGRQHQLRVHVASLGCPILGDQAYGGQKVCRVGGIDIPRMLLHARILGFRHPISEKWEEFFVGMPSEMEGVLEKLKLQSG